MGARLRADLRADEDDWTRAAVQYWTHARTLADVAREFAARGDDVVVDTAGRSFRGVIVAVGDDRLDLATSDAMVHVRLALAEAIGAPLAPLALYRSARARRGGVRPPAALVTFRARLLELEIAGQPVRVGSSVVGGEFTGCLTVGRDHVVVHGPRETVLPVCWLSYVVVDGAGRAA
jgi:hypothetical protein